MAVHTMSLANQDWQLSLRNQLRKKIVAPLADVQREEVASRLQTIASGSDRILLRVQAVFPFDLFPDVVSIDFNKINIIHKIFLWNEDIHSVLIDDVTDVYVDRLFMLSTLHIIDSSNVRFPIHLMVSKLLPNHANYARRLIQGLIAARRLRIDITGMSLGSVYTMLQKLGSVGGEE